MHRSLRVLVPLAALVALAFGFAVRPAATRAGDAEQRARAGTIVDRRPLSFAELTVHAPLWKISVPAWYLRFDADPAVVGDGTVFVGSGYAGPLTAVDARTSRVRWSFAAAPLAYSGGRVFAIVRARPGAATVVALDAGTGAVHWKTRGRSVAIVAQLAIVTTGSEVKALDAASGALRWSALWSGPPPRVSLHGTTLFLAAVESGAILHGEVHAFDVRDGRALWVTGANRIIGFTPDGNVALDTTWLPGAPDHFAGIKVGIFSRWGTERSEHVYSPDRDRFALQIFTGGPATVAREPAVSGGAVAFALGPDSVYRYPLEADPEITPGVRFDLRSALPLGDGSWLVRRTDNRAGLARFDGTRAVVQTLDGLGDVTFAAVFGRLAFVAARDRAVVFDPHDPDGAAVSRFSCSTVAKAFVADGAVVALCGAPTPMLVALAVPDGTKLARATPIPLRPQSDRRFRVKVSAHDVPTEYSRVDSAAFDASGALWFAEHPLFFRTASGEPNPDRIGRLNRDGSVSEFALTVAQSPVGALARGPDGAIWFAETAALKVGRIASDGTVREFSLPAALDGEPTYPTRPGGRAILPPQLSPSRIGFGPPRRIQKLGDLTAGPDGALWITARYAQAIGRLAPNGDVRVYGLPHDLAGPGHITAGPDGALWFTARDAVGRLRPDGSVTRFAVDTHRTMLTSIVWGPDGNIWFSIFGGSVGRITPKGALRIFPGPVVDAPAGPLIGGCDGALYDADPYGTSLWRVGLDGTFVHADVPFEIGALVRAPDCTLGFTEAQGPRTTHVGTITR